MAQLKAGTTIDGRVVMKEFDDLITRIGNNEDLNTTQKASLILAINEVYAKANSNESSIADINDSISQLADMISGLGNDLTEHENKTALDDVHGLMSGGHIIEEWGENENGYYIRYGDGTQICYHRESLTDGQDQLIWTFPSEFSFRYYVNGVVVRSSPSYGNHFVADGSQSSLLNSVARLNIESDNPTSRNIQLLAIGRWK